MAEQFSRLASPAQRNPIIGQFWKKVAEEAIRVGRAELFEKEKAKIIERLAQNEAAGNVSAQTKA